MGSNANIPAPDFDAPRPPGMEASQGVDPNLPMPEVNDQTELHNMELPAAQSVAPPVAPPIQQQMAAAPTAAPPAQPATPVIPHDDLHAEDSDLIEKAWVEKAKAIVAQTRDDPYMQNKEINRVKASYIKKRYGKDIKVSDEQTQ